MTVTNLPQFLNKFKANAQLSLNVAAKTLNSSADELKERIVTKTPVGNPALWHPPYWPSGYVPGTLQSSWQVSFNKNTRSSTGQFSNAAGILAENGISFSLSNLKGGSTITIYNAQPYAQRVEEGWSSQAPAGMMRTSIMEFTSILNANAAKYRIK